MLRVVFQLDDLSDTSIEFPLQAIVLVQLVKQTRTPVEVWGDVDF
jgi:hypothetical protein